MTTITKSKTTIAALSAAQARPEEPDNWSAGAEDCDGNLLVTIRADELAALAEFAAGPGLSEYRIDGDMVRREVLSVRMQQLAADARSGAALSRPAAQGGEAVAWDVYEHRIYGAPGEKRHRVLWVEHYRQDDGTTPDLDWLLEGAMDGGIDGRSKTIHVRPLFYDPPALPALQEPQWQPIETAPKDGSLFLCWVSATNYGETDEGQQYQEDASQADFCSWLTSSDIGWFDPCCGQIADQQAVTHWMPLPAAPGIGSSPKESGNG